MATTNTLHEKSLYADILQADEDSRGSCGKVSILSCSEEPLLYSGFTSTLIRVRVEYRTEASRDVQTRSFIVKVPFSNPAVNEVVFTKNEYRMYDEVLPKIVDVAQLSVAPNRYPCVLPDYLVMEDLTAAGYNMCDSIARLDFKHTKAVLITLAKFHAASIAVKHKYPGLIERNGTEWLFSNDPKICNHFKPRILIRLYGLARVLQETPGCERYGDILIDAGEAFWELMVELHKPNSKLDVLTHGDLWTNNILFKYDGSGSVVDVKLVDFQMRRLCSPAIDLLQLFWTSVDDVARLRMYELLEMYRHTLNNFLSEHGCPERLSRQQLKEEVSKRSGKILLICLFLPLTMPDEELPLDLNNLDDSEESVTSTDFNLNPFLVPFNQQYYRTVLPEVCKELDTMKIFQILIKNKNRV